jgi:hypothetical protein
MIDPELIGEYFGVVNSTRYVQDGVEWIEDQRSGRGEKCVPWFIALRPFADRKFFLACKFRGMHPGQLQASTLVPEETRKLVLPNDGLRSLPKPPF